MGACQVFMPPPTNPLLVRNGNALPGPLRKYSSDCHAKRIDETPFSLKQDCFFGGGYRDLAEDQGVFLF